MKLPERPVKTNITPQVMARVHDADRLISIYGHWPDFHNCEILAVALDRGNHMQVVETGDWSGRVAPSLTAKILTFDFRYGDDKSRKYRLVTLRFNGVGDFHMEAFGYQNPVMGIGLIAEPEVGETALLRVDWGGTVMGHETVFTCESIDVLNVEPFDPTFAVKANWVRAGF